MSQRAFNISGRLGLDVTGFNKKLGESQKNLNTFRAKINKQARMLKKDLNGVTQTVKSLAGEIALLGAAAGGFLLLSKKANETAEEIGKLASTTASTTREIQALTIAFKENGLEADDVGDVLNTLADRAQDAKDGMQSFIDDFALIGIEVDELRGKRPAELFETFADAIAETDDPIKRQAALVRILGDDLGRKLAPELAKGAEHFRKLAKEAEAAGLIMDAGTIEAATKANRAMERLQTTIETGVTRVIADLAPYIEALSNKIRELTTNNVNFERVTVSVFSNVVKAVGVLADGVHALELGFQGAKVIALGFTSALSVGVNGLLGVLADFGNAVKDFVLAPLKWVLTAASKLPMVGKEIGSIVEEINGIQFAPPDLMSDFADSQIQALEGMIDTLGEMMMEPLPSELFDDVLADIQRTTEGIKAAAEAADKAREDTKPDEDGGEGGEKKKTDPLNLEELNKRAKDFETMTVAIRENVSTQSAAIEQDFGNAMLGVAQSMAGAMGVGKEFFAITQAVAAADAIVKGLQTAAAVRLAYAQMAALSGPAAPGILAAGETQAAMATASGFATAGMIAGQTLASFDGGGFTGSGARTGGVDGIGGFPAILHPNETVVDHAKGQGMGAQQVNINFNVQATDSKSFQDSLVQNRGMITSIVQQALANQGRRLG